MRYIRCNVDTYSFLQKDYVYEVVCEGTHEGVYILNNNNHTAVPKVDFDVVEEFYLNKFQSDTIVSMLEHELMCTGYTDNELEHLEFVKGMLERRSFE